MRAAIGRDASHPTGHEARATPVSVPAGAGRSEPMLLGLQALAGNEAVAHLVADPSTHRGLIELGPTVQRDDDAASGGDGEVTSLAGGGAGAGTGSTTVGPPTKSTYAVSGSLTDAANTIAARTEAGSETSTPSLDTVTDGGRIVTATVTVAQAIELPSWADRASGTPAQQAEWDRFSAAITAHEDGHVAKDVAAWAGAHAKIAGKSEKDGNDTFDAISRASDKSNDDYDTATKHGLTQGTGIDPNV
jgi:hypothetical protein